MRDLLDKLSALENLEESNTPEIGDEFGISFSPDFEISTHIVEVLEDGIVVELDDTALEMLTNEGVRFFEGELVEGVAGPKSCWKGYRKTGTQPGTGKNAGKRVNDCEKIKEDEVEESGLQYYTGVKKHGKEYMTKAAQAARDGASQEELGALKDRFSKAHKGKAKNESVAEGMDSLSFWKREAQKAGGAANIDWYAIGVEHGKQGIVMNPPYGVGGKAVTLYGKGLDAGKQGVAEGNSGAKYKIKSIGYDAKGDYYISPSTGKKVYKKGVKVGDHENPKTGEHKGVAEGNVDEAKYQGREVQLGKKMAGDVKKSKVYVKNPQGNVVKVNFGDKKMRIKKSNPARRKSFRARHNCANPGPRHKARYWSCRSW
jgi:hypothetical protein